MLIDATHSGREVGARPDLAPESESLAILATFCSDVPASASLGSDWMIGIYFLIASDKIVYVGQSVDVFRRIYAHRSDNARHRSYHPEHAKPFDRAIWMRLPENELDDFESALTRFLRPVHNSQRHARRSPPSRDAAIIAALGLDAT